MGNAFAYVALLGFFPIAAALFALLPPARALLAVFLASFQFLPELVGVDLPSVPSIGKQEVAAIAGTLGVALRAPRELLRARPFCGPEMLVLLLFVGDLGTVITNRDAVVWGSRVLPGLTLHEGLSLIVLDLLRYGLPFFLGRALFRDARALRSCLAGLALAGAIYSPLLFVELMLSPQLHRWVYGFHQHQFVQTLRGGGYRPVVFMPHGLAVGVFMAWAGVASMTLVKARKRVLGTPAGLAAVYNLGWLLACKSLGAALYGLVATPVLLFLKARTALHIAVLLVVVVIAYPVLRASGALPERTMVHAARLVSERAAQSLEFRFTMESMLAERAAERPLFGWGRFGRSMVFDEVTENPISVSDGHWIVVYGMSGAWGFVCVFGLLVAPVFLLQRRIQRVEARDLRILLAGLACIVAISALDLVPNGFHNSIVVLLAGALWGTTQGLSARPIGCLRTGEVGADS